MKFVALIPVGPNPQEIERLTDLFNALFYFEEPGTTGLVLVNDGASESALETLAERYRLAFADIVPNPRAGRGDPWSDGMTVGVIAGFAHIARERADAPFVLKMDTDTLVINRFSDAIVRYFKAHPQFGLIGTYLSQPGGRGKTNTLEAWKPWISKMLRPLTLWNMPSGRHLQFTLLGRARAIRKTIKAAISHGYLFGESCIGGGYALSRDALRKMSSERVLNDPHLFLNRCITEDVAIGLLARSVGIRLADFNARGEPFGVIWQGLCAPPHDLLEAGYAIIHSVKDTASQHEAEIRAFFAQERGNTDRSNAPAPGS